MTSDLVKPECDEEQEEWRVKPGNLNISRMNGDTQLYGLPRVRHSGPTSMIIEERVVP